MSSFFTAPASQKKRKRTGPAATAPEKRSRKRREDSISSGESDDDNRPEAEEYESDGSSDAENETAAERRLRLAERYLENIKEEVDEAGFDAAEIDRDLIAERLKEDVAEGKGKVYRRIATTLDFDSATKNLFRSDNLATTAVATCAPYAYTATKDMCLIKWQIQSPPNSKADHPSNLTPRRRPTQLAYTKGNKRYGNDPKYQHHTAPILCVAASADGKFVATGGADRRLIIWNAKDLSPLKVFTHHRDAVNALAFRRNTNQLFSASSDRTIKVWSLDELAYVDTLFGHQDSVVDIGALAQERCVSVGSRDRTARLWKVVEESQLVFRGGGSSEKRIAKGQSGAHAEGSIDKIAMVDEDTFVTGSDNGSISLWSVHKKKPVFTLPLAHGLDPPMKPEEVHADAETNEAWIPPQIPRWITALATIPYTDVILSGSWDGWVRAWKVSDDGKRLEAIGTIGATGSSRATTEESDGCQQAEENVRGVINDLSIFERGDRGRDGVCVVAAVGKEMKFGRWKQHPGKNAAVVFEVSKKAGDGVNGDQQGAEEAD
ncbi:WD40-repeat-containing domain protein [Phyllosticta citriasiana]|uniref:WD40-repeat-containing domain protein n=1 Tax=Phyllosticta citriasiana TaxID=595635 RepID=A0ABR1KG73_9PEZI